MKTSLLSNNERHILPIWTPLMSEATCGGAQRSHTSVAGGDSTEGQKPLKSKNLSRRQVPLQSRESPVCVGARLYKTRNLRKAATHQDLKYLCQAGSPRFA